MEGEKTSIFKALDRLTSKLKDFVICTTGACGVERDVDDWAFARKRTVLHFREPAGKGGRSLAIREMVSFALEKKPAFAVLFQYGGNGIDIDLQCVLESSGVKHKIIELKE